MHEKDVRLNLPSIGNEMIVILAKNNDGYECIKFASLISFDQLRLQPI